MQSHVDELEVYGLISECWDNLLIKEESGASAIALGQCAASLNFEVHYWAGLPYPEWFGEILEKDLFSFEFKERSVPILLQDRQLTFMPCLIYVKQVDIL